LLPAPIILFNIVVSLTCTAYRYSAFIEAGIFIVDSPVTNWLHFRHKSSFGRLAPMIRGNTNQGGVTHFYPTLFIIILSWVLQTKLTDHLRKSYE
jgi:hypothetical protein